MATPQQIQTSVDAQLATLLPELESVQAAFFAEHGRYLQLLPSHDIPPDDGVSKKPDKLDRKPSHETKGWEEIKSDLSGMKFSLRSDEYQSPQGPGRVYVATFTKGSATYARSRNFGPETYFERPWRIIPPTIPGR